MITHIDVLGPDMRLLKNTEPIQVLGNLKRGTVDYRALASTNRDFGRISDHLDALAFQDAGRPAVGVTFAHLGFDYEFMAIYHLLHRGRIHFVGNILRVL